MRVMLLAVLFGATLASAAPDLEALVGAEEFAALGLGKLSPQERQRLASWLQRRLDGRPVPIAAPSVAFAVDGARLEATVAVPQATTVQQAMPAAPVVPPAAEVAAAAEAFGREDVDDDDAPDGIRARIVGRFEGWDGKTLFRLDNGQVWRQTGAGRYKFVADDPEVTIERAAIGYKLRLVETERAVQVRRVQ